MAKTDEEEYLDSLLKSMSMDESDNTTKKVNDTDIKLSLIHISEPTRPY